MNSAFRNVPGTVNGLRYSVLVLVLGSGICLEIGLEPSVPDLGLQQYNVGLGLGKWALLAMLTESSNEIFSRYLI